eukprot:jgi/Ulvmu1/10150/UM006_0104.1
MPNRGGRSRAQLEDLPVNQRSQTSRTCAGVRREVLLAEQESESIDDHDAQEPVQQENINVLKRRTSSKVKATAQTSADAGGRNKRVRTSESTPTVSTFLMGLQKRLSAAGSSATGVKASSISWYHREWYPVEKTEEYVITINNLTTMKRDNPKMQCRHCNEFTKTYNPSTRYKKHLLSNCPAFAKTGKFQSAVVQRDLKELTDKQTRAAGVAGLAHP